MILYWLRSQRFKQPASVTFNEIRVIYELTHFCTRASQILHLSVHTLMERILFRAGWGSNNTHQWLNNIPLKVIFL